LYRIVPIGTRFYNFQSPTPTFLLKIPTSGTTDVRAIWRVANKLKLQKPPKSTQISKSPIAIVSMLHGYSRQRRTIGFFSATADFLVDFVCRRTVNFTTGFL